MQMDDPKYDPDTYYEDYDDYREGQVTGVGLPPGQLALIIGVNAVISLIISVVVVLIANRQVLPGDIATPVGGAEAATAESARSNAPPASEVEVTATSVTPVESKAGLLKEKS